MPLGLRAQPQEPAGQQRGLEPQIERKLRLAFDYHELAKLYLKKGEADKAVTEIRKVLQLSLPVDYEPMVVQSIAYVSDKLGEIRRFDTAQALLDDTLKSVEQPTNQARVLKTKARLFLASGDDDRAIESWKRALEMEAR
jgi:predicted negative regulator of RcsB-dependent stress response